MNLLETDEERTFRARVRDWMKQHLCGEFEPLRHAGALGTSGEAAALAKRWEQQLAAGGWTGLGWPRQHGGHDLPLAQQVIFHEEKGGTLEGHLLFNASINYKIADLW